MLRDNRNYCDFCGVQIPEEQGVSVISVEPDDLRLLLSSSDLPGLSRNSDGTISVDTCGKCEPFATHQKAKAARAS
jgi:hypothetical protein